MTQLGRGRKGGRSPRQIRRFTRLGLVVSFPRGIAIAPYLFLVKTFADVHFGTCRGLKKAE